jgi:hypothetical protein
MPEIEAVADEFTDLDPVYSGHGIFRNYQRNCSESNNATAAA